MGQIEITNKALLKDIKIQINRLKRDNSINKKILQLFLIKQNLKHSDYYLTNVGNYEDFNKFIPSSYCFIDSQYIFVYSISKNVFNIDTSIVSNSNILKKIELFPNREIELEKIKVGDNILSKYYRINNLTNEIEKIDTIFDIYNRKNFINPIIIVDSISQ